MNDTPTINNDRRPTAAISKPKVPLIKAVIARIESRPDLAEALSDLWGAERPACMERLATIVAQALIDREEIDNACHERDQAQDLVKKTGRRWVCRSLSGRTRGRQIRRFSKIAHRRIMSTTAVAHIHNRPARHSHDFYRRCATLLYDLFAWRSQHPSKLVAAITGLFNLHPREFCVSCPHLPSSRGGKMGAYSLTERVRRGLGMCKLHAIFQCPQRSRKSPQTPKRR